MREMTRRSFLQTAALAGGAVIGLPVLQRAASAQTTLSLALWDHWVPGANDVFKQILEDWGKANNVKVQADFLGRELSTIAAAESRGKTGHDIVHFWEFDATFYKNTLEPVDDVAEALMKQYGDYHENAWYLSYQDGHWIALPNTVGAQSFPLVTRIDLWKEHAGIDVTDIFPADVSKRDPKKIATFNLDTFLTACKKLAAAGYMFGNPISEFGDSNNWLCPILASFGSIPVTEKGDIAIESDATLEGIEYIVELTKLMPQDIFGWDNASNNRWIISGKGSAIMNPPSAWAVAKRDRPEIAAQIWHHDTPVGPKGHFRGAPGTNYGIWNFSKNKQAAKDLLTHLFQKEQQWKLLDAGQGFDMPPLKSFYSHPVWVENGPPVGGLYNYVPRGDEKLIMGGWPAKPDLAVQINRKYLIPVMIAKAATGEMTPKEAMKWAAGELEEYIEG